MTERRDFAGDVLLDIFPVVVGQNGVKPRHDALDFGFFHTPCRDGRCPQTQTAGCCGILLIIGNRVAIDNQADCFELFFGQVSGQSPGAQVNENQMIIRSTAHDAITAGCKLLGHTAGVGKGLVLNFTKGGFSRPVETDRLGGDHIHGRGSLAAGEYGPVDAGGMGAFA